MQPINSINQLKTFSSNDSSFKTSFKNFCQKISRFVKSIFCCFPAKPKLFSKKDLGLLRDHRIKPTQLPNPQKKLEGIVTRESAPLAVTKNPLVKAAPPYVVYDDSLENIREFLRDFSNLSADILYKHHMETKIENIQSSATSLPSLVKSIAKLLVEIGDKAKPLFQKFSQQKAQVIDPALRKIFKTLIKEDQTLLREHLLSHLQQSPLVNSLSREKSLDYIKPTISWILHPDGKNLPISNFFQSPEHLDTELISALLDEATIFVKKQQSIARATLHTSLNASIQDQLKNSNIPIGNLEITYIDSILDWLLNSDLTTPLTDLFTPQDQYVEDLIDKIFELAVTSLLERKIDQYANILEKTLQHRLGEIVQQTIKSNASRFADFFSGRFAELVSKMPYTKLFDTVVHETITQQVEGYLESEKAYYTEKNRLQQSKILSEIDPQNNEEIEQKIRSQNHINSVANYGSEEAFLQSAFLEKFSQQQACNSNIQQFIDQQIQLGNQSKNSDQIKKAYEKALFSALAENLLSLMLPTRKKVDANGQIEDIDPFVELWENLYLPEEFYDLIQHVEELASEFITLETRSLFLQIKQPTLDIVKNMFKTTVQDILKKQLINQIEKAFKKLTISSNLDEIVAKNILPAINSKLTNVTISQELEGNIKTFAPLFLKLIQDPLNREANIADLQKKLLKLVKENTRNFDWKNYHLNKELNGSKQALSEKEWLNLSLPVVLAAEDFILKSQTEENVDISKITLSDITILLNKSFQSSNAKSDPRFGKLALDLIFKVGGWKHEKALGYFIENTLSTVLSNNLQNLRISHSFLIDSIANGLKDSFLDREYLENLFFDRFAPDPIDNKIQLAHQIDLTSQLVHDIIFRSVEQKGSLVKFGVKQILTNKPDEINKLITTVYKKLFGNPILNQNLITNICEDIFQAFSISAETIRNSENLLAHQMACV